MALVSASDMQNMEEVKTILANGEFDKESLNVSLEMATAHGNLDLMRLILKYKPDIEFIDKLTIANVYDPIFPEIIYILQMHCSSQVLAESHRSYMKNRQSCYLVGPSEERKMNLKIKTATPKTRASSEIEQQVATLKRNCKLNDELLDTYSCDSRLMMHRMLSLNREHRPSQFTVNRIFTLALSGKGVPPLRSL